VNGVVQGLSAAALFGASAPLAKVLLPGCSPLVLAGLLYLFAAIALSIYAAVRPVAPREAPLQRADVLPLLGVVLLGGGLGPVLMLTGLERVSGLVGSLLLNLEAPFTMLFAVTLFGEHLARREATAALAIVLGAAVLGGGDAAGLSSTGLTADPVGVACLAGACLCWGFDNNLCQRLSLRDPIAVVRVKTAAAGAGNLVLAMMLGEVFPAPGVLAGAAVVGALGYGLSLVLDMQALRALGAAREAAYFATAPFLGAALSIPLLGDRPGLVEGAGAAFMVLGVVILRRERHDHSHTHEPLEHDHVHMHDAHHQHAHDGDAGPEPHAHPHRHEAVTHAHPHVPDAHHRHRHG
jgi:drug/metabolite transporter (DMT)-like permease